MLACKTIIEPINLYYLNETSNQTSETMCSVRDLFQLKLAAAP